MKPYASAAILMAAICLSLSVKAQCEISKNLLSDDRFHIFTTDLSTFYLDASYQVGINSYRVQLNLIEDELNNKNIAIELVLSGVFMKHETQKCNKMVIFFDDNSSILLDAHDFSNGTINRTPQKDGNIQYIESFFIIPAKDWETILKKLTIQKIEIYDMEKIKGIDITPEDKTILAKNISCLILKTTN